MKKENTYADKVEVTQTNDAFPDYIGHQCRKGRKPESPNQDSFSITMHDGVMMQVFAVFGTIFDNLINNFYFIKRSQVESKNCTLL